MRATLPARSRSAVALLACALMAGCTVGPDYRRPEAVISTRFKEADGWRPAQPFDAIDKGAWWSIFPAPALDVLARRVAISNQTLKEYEAAYRQAHQIVKEARASFFPTLSANASIQDQHSPGGSFTTTAGGATVVNSGGTSATNNLGSSTTSYSASVDASWVPDLWGRIRRTVEGDVANAQASAADIANARLSAQSELAQDYFQVRVLDDQANLYRETVAGYQKFSQLTTNQYKAGVAARADVIAAQTQLLSAQAQLVDIGVMRGQMEHAVAVLTGVAPADLTIPAAQLSRDVPVAPTGVASALLERRPDIAAAERRADAANAQIGVQEAAFYPDVTISGSYGGESSGGIGRLFNLSNALWSVGSQAAETLVDFGARRASVRAARAAYDQEVAIYRQTVLIAFQNVEDQLVALRVLEREYAIRLQAEQAARQAQAVSLNQYRAGQVNYTTVITNQATALNASQSVLSVLQQRLQASVGLVEALGGGWDTSELPRS